MSHYYSLKTKKEEHRLEPRIGGEFDYGLYDLKENLLKPKVIIKKEEVVEFIWNKQQELKSVFKKLEVTVEKKKTTIEDQILEKINAGMDKGWKSEFYETKETETLNTKQTKTKTLLTGKGRNDIMRKDTEYIIIARLDLDSNDVELEVHSNPKGDMVKSSIEYKQIIDHLFLSLVTSFPDFIENHICAGMHKQTGIPYEEVVKGYREQKSMRTKAYLAITEMLTEVVQIYKKQIEE